MPQIVDPSGQIQTVPGVYTEIRATSNGPGPLPEFLVPVMVVDSYSGFPSNWISASDRFTDETSRLPFILTTDSGGAKRAFGDGCDMVRAFNVAKLHGLPRAYCISAGKLVRWSIIVTSTGPVNQFTIGGYYWGFPAGWTKIKFASSIFSYSVPEKLSKITANVSSGATRIYVDRNDWVVENQTLELGDNDSVNESVVVLGKGTETNSDGTFKPYIDLTAATSAAYTTSAYAAIALYGTNVVTSSAFASGEGQKLIDWINANGGTALRAQRHASFTGALPIAVSSLTPMKDISGWGTRTLGTSPSASASDIQDFLDDLDERLYEDFEDAVKAPPRAFFFGTSDATAHANISTWLRAQRALGTGAYASAIVGCAWGDTVLSASDSTSPIYRARQLNNQDMRLVACGADGIGANLSRAPAVFGLYIGGGVGHNLTFDQFLGFTVDEKRWSLKGGDIDKLCRGGVISYLLKTISGASTKLLTQGLNTLQSNAATWNPSDGTTPFIHQRDLADYIDVAVKTDCVNLVVGQEVDINDVSALANARLQRLGSDGFLASYTINSIERNAEANGWNIDYSVGLPGVTDYVSIITNVQYE
jgi:hypothetical protein